MRWRDKGIRFKIGAGLAVVLFFLVAVTAFSITGVNGIVRNAGEVISGNELDRNLAQREVDHLNWATKVNALLTDKKITRLEVETDYRKCGFGAWLYGDGRTRAEILVPSLAPLLKEIELPHQQLHESAIEIGRIFRQGDLKLGAFLRDKKNDHLIWMHTVKDVFLNEKQNKVEVELDPTQCGLGRWLYSEEVGNLKKSDPDFAAVWASLEEPHRKLHQSAAHINLLLGENRKPEALEFYRLETKKAAKETLAQIDRIISENDERVKGMEEAARIFTEQTAPALKVVQTLLNRIREESRKNIMTDQVMMEAAKSTRENVVILAVSALLAGFLSIYFIPKGIVRPISMMIENTQRLIKGDLEVEFEKSGDEVGRMGDVLNSMLGEIKRKAGIADGIASGDLNQEIRLASDKDTFGRSLDLMVRSLNKVVGEAIDSSTQVASGAEQVAGASQALSQGATEQAASLEQIASSMTQLASQTKANAENATQANTLSLGARDEAGNGNRQMQKMIEAMNEIQSSSKEIAQIIKAIDDIAFQTNLLALNAAVEAARAGRHGKGFAVVAQEVRNLAGRSARAAQETAELIESSVKKVENGTGIVNSTADTLAEIVKISNKVNDLVGEIARASNEQALGITQINQGLNNVERVTQQNTANSEETAAAAENLAAQAMQLRELVSHFKLKGQDEFDSRSPRISASGKSSSLLLQG